MLQDLDVGNAAAGSGGKASSAGDAVRALVCGYAEPVRSRRLLIMLQAFVDDSYGDKTRGQFVLAGWVSTAARWEAFAKDWDHECAQAPATRDFHMSEAERIKGPYWGFQGGVSEDDARARQAARVSALAGLIKKHTAFGVVATLDMAVWDRVAKGKLPVEANTPYFYLFWRVIQCVVQAQRVRQSTEKVNFVFDDQSVTGHEANAWHPLLLSILTEEERAMISGTPTFAHDNEVIPLKAADMLAWHVRRDFHDRDVAEAAGREYRQRDAMGVFESCAICTSPISEDYLTNAVIMAAFVKGMPDYPKKP